MNEHLKFRAWNKHGMGEPFTLKDGTEFKDTSGAVTWPDPTIFMQCVGHVDSANKEIYQGDILRETIEEEHGDINHYFIVTWINEWSMFAALMHTEYDGYLKRGAESLDESMFWTFTIERGNSFTVCGNIYEHPDYIRKCLEAEEI